MLVWLGFRPYLIRFSIDLLIFVTLWLILLVIHWLTKLLPLASTMATFLAYCHELFVFLSFLAVSLLALYDLIEPRLRR